MAMTLRLDEGLDQQVQQLADALGVSKPFLYYYLKNKDDILFECSRIATEQLHEMLDEVRKATAGLHGQIAANCNN